MSCAGAHRGQLSSVFFLPSSFSCASDSSFRTQQVSISSLSACDILLTHVFSAACLELLRSDLLKSGVHHEICCKVAQGVVEGEEVHLERAWAA